MNNNDIPLNMNIAPKDCSKVGIPILPCDNGETTIFNGTPALGMAYVPMQKFKDLYNPEKGLPIGTIFSELDKPFCGIGGKLL
jgi:hypothetical protein